MDKARREESITHIHNEQLVDEYEWLRDKNWPVVNSTEIIDYLNNENLKTGNYFNKYTKIEEQIYKEIRSKVVENDESYPIIKGGYSYYLKMEKDKGYPIYCRKSIKLAEKEEVLLDINKMDAKGCSHHTFKVSPGHDLLSYSIDSSGEDKYKIITKNIENPKMTYEEIEGADGNIIWDQMGVGFFYVRLNSKLRGSAVYYHKLKNKQEEDKLIYEENDEVFELEISKTSDEKYLLITSLSSNENEVRYINLTNNASQKKLFERSEGKIFIIDHKECYFYIKSNYNGKNFRLSKVEDDHLYELDKWSEIIPHDGSEYILDFSLSYKYLVVNKKIQGVTKIYVYDEKEEVKIIDLEEEVYSASGILPTYDSEFVRVKYSSLVTPTSILEYDFQENKIYERKVKKLNFEYDKGEYEYKMIHARAKDDELIPISIVYKSDKFHAKAVAFF
jgi:oligopeptidase B